METASNFRAAERSNGSLLAALEKRTLIWLAERLPAWVNSDHLTALGFLSLVGVGLSYWYSRYSRAGLVLAVVFFVLNWFGDSLDGTLARVRQQQRPRYGFYVDHVLDACGSVFIFARVVHAFGLSRTGGTSPERLIGTTLTLLVLLVMAALLLLQQFSR